MWQKTLIDQMRALNDNKNPLNRNYTLYYFKSKRKNLERTQEVTLLITEYLTNKLEPSPASRELIRLTVDLFHQVANQLTKNDSV